MNRSIAYCALVETAKRNNIPLDMILNEINSAISIAMKDPDPCAQAFWSAVPKAGDVPTPVEVIAYMAQQARELDLESNTLQDAL